LIRVIGARSRRTRKMTWEWKKRQEVKRTVTPRR